ncbi:hypothetical protein [Prescottella agglutinans]|uniref:Uncharacterized protein n=1 Tax=Prescottella agglutinans TaxID=1644129 RepID=A0ABT6MGV4_9NOCA|nr:hypothetical protein [Prescottella agglutinans]MDH6283547.1 hypothetical protein [Prescottella agglutinans]
MNEAAPVDDGLVAELFEEASDIERKLFEVRSAETVEAMRSWRANAESQAVKAVAGNG